jgi:hypothetical protein
MIREGRWDFWSPAFMVGRQVTGKRFGVLGMGRVGQVTAERARGFGMEIHYHNRRRLDPALEKGAVFHDTVEGLMAVSDVLSLHCPATPETRDVINARTLALLPEGAILVNTARGALVDEAALVAALKSGRLFAAGLDVFKNGLAAVVPAQGRARRRGRGRVRRPGGTGGARAEPARREDADLVAGVRHLDGLRPRIHHPRRGDVERAASPSTCCPPARWSAPSR